jgi:hypothetical protein
MLTVTFGGKVCPVFYSTKGKTLSRVLFYKGQAATSDDVAILNLVAIQCTSKKIYFCYCGSHMFNGLFLVIRLPYFYYT